MQLSRRLFVQMLTAAGAAAAGNPLLARSKGNAELDERLQNLRASTATNKVIWLSGSGCSGCSVSFLNRFADTAPKTAADVLLDVALVGYQPVIMAAAGDQAVATAESFYEGGGGSYILVVEGGVPTAFNGAACFAWRNAQGQDVTFLDAVKRYAERATAIVCIGTCACYGGVSAAPPNPTQVKSVSEATGLKTINLPGCPVHPDWLVMGLAAVLADASIRLDSAGRPEGIYATNLHEKCPRNAGPQTVGASTYGVDNQCLKQLGCRGPLTMSTCPSHKWNSGKNWCVDANAPCLGCTEPSFPVKGFNIPVR